MGNSINNLKTEVFVWFVLVLMWPRISMTASSSIQRVRVLADVLTIPHTMGFRCLLEKVQSVATSQDKNKK